MVRLASFVMALALAFGFSSAVRAEDTKEEKKGAVANGVVKAVDAEKKTFTITVGEGEKATDVVVSTTETTVVKVGKEDGKFDDIVVGATVKVVHVDAVASEVHVKPAKKEKGEKAE